VKEYLSQRSIPFREVDVSQDPAAAAEMVRVSGQQGVPVTTVDGTVIVGYDRPRLDEALAQAQRPRLGAAVADAAEMAGQGRTTVRQGAYVGRVSAGGAAASAGLQAGDVIVALAGQPINSALYLERLMAGVRRGHSLPLTYIRDGEQIQTTLRF
jgi:S1-C subfamily serine protease